MDSLIADSAWTALFILSFLAATLVPLGSEWLLALLIMQKYDPTVSLLIATSGNTLGACTTYGLGIYGSSWVTEKVLRIDPEKRLRAEQFYQRYGFWSLLFTWLPVIGDPICLVGGILRINFPRFVILAGLGKLARYTIVVWLALQASAS
ncbi:MAG: hypothetical protein C0623_13705 [Desulfuromonas sp.]|nr:MAG: hypothetical protein C0623_13705 [Desulfuromonas sp.]